MATKELGDGIRPSEQGNSLRDSSENSAVDHPDSLRIGSKSVNGELCWDAVHPTLLGQRRRPVCQQEKLCPYGEERGFDTLLLWKTRCLQMSSGTLLNTFARG